ncbi:MAG: helix-turn-helix transcriptional regulator [Akkermansiaceae bacterium]|nr:helix-turn-helix transcriptional regulator [Akkermansiaceae bacterium]
MAVRKVPKDPEIERKNIVGPRIREARKTYHGGLTQDHLSGRLAALRVSIDRAGIAKIELGIRHVYDFELAALARALKVDVKWLLGIETSGGPAKIGRRVE